MLQDIERKVLRVIANFETGRRREPTIGELCVKTGRMEFVPFKYNTWGTLYEWEYKVYEGKDPQKTLEDVDEVDVYLPIENSRGEAEGMFILKEKKGEYTP